MAPGRWTVIEPEERDAREEFEERNAPGGDDSPPGPEEGDERE